MTCTPSSRWSRGAGAKWSFVHHFADLKNTTSFAKTGSGQAPGKLTELRAVFVGSVSYPGEGMVKTRAENIALGARKVVAPFSCGKRSFCLDRLGTTSQVL
jgi:hypothetical protein